MRFKVRVRQVIGFGRAQIFVRQVGAVYAFVVGGECDGNVVFHVDRQRMVISAHAENDVVRGEAYFHQNVALGHFMQQCDGIFFVHHINTVADALGVSAIDGGANVKGQVLRWNQANREFAGVQRDVHLWDRRRADNQAWPYAR